MIEIIKEITVFILSINVVFLWVSAILGQIRINKLENLVK